MRNNSFAGYIERPNQTRGFIKNNKPGAPDIIVCYQGNYVGLEVKSKKGRQSDSQKDAEERILDAGGEYHIVRSVEDVQEIIK